MKKTRLLAMLLFLSTVLSSCLFFNNDTDILTLRIVMQNRFDKDTWVVFCQHELRNRPDSLTAYAFCGGSQLQKMTESLTYNYDSICEIKNGSFRMCYFSYGYGADVSWREHFQISQIDSICILTFNSHNDASEWIRMRNNSLLNKKFSYSLADIDVEYSNWTIELKGEKESE